MNYKIFLSDFDGTLVNTDILDIICGINNKYEESIKINEDYLQGKTFGLEPLKKRIDLLKGITNLQIKELLDKNNYLLPGAEKLFEFLKENNIVTVLHSGNITPVLNYYKEYLNIDYIVGNEPRYENGIIQGIELSDFKSNNFKLDGCMEIMNKLGIIQEEVIAIGDSVADIKIFEISNLKIAINPKGGIENKVDYVIKDLNQVIDLVIKKQG